MNKRVLVLIGLLLQTVAVFGLFAPNAYHHAVGEVITLQTIPVDPMSIFRGQYVTLDYEIGSDAPTDAEWGSVTYVTLRKNESGVYERVNMGPQKPVLQEGEVCLRGRNTGWGRIEFPDIGQYFVQEGLGTEIENLRNMHVLLADISVVGCSGLIKQLRLGEEVPGAPVDRFGEPTVRPFESL